MEELIQKLLEAKKLAEDLPTDSTSSWDTKQQVIYQIEVAIQELQ